MVGCGSDRLSCGLFRAATSRAYTASVLSASRLSVKRGFASAPGLHHMVAAPNINPAAVAAQLARERSVEYVEPNFIVHAVALSDDPLLPQQWALNNTGASHRRD
jgi:hypothetical protein